MLPLGPLASLGNTQKEQKGEFVAKKILKLLALILPFSYNNNYGFTSKDKQHK